MMKGGKNMIKKTFFNLPTEKRDRIIREIKREFADYQVDKISINRIIQRANISRGSFYQYFDDKADLVTVVTSEFSDYMYNVISQSMRNSGGDVFRLPMDMFNGTMEFVQRGDNFAIYKNLFANIKANGDDLCEYFGCLSKEKLKRLEDMVNKGQNNMNQKESAALKEILLLVTRGAIFDVFARGKNVKEVADSIEMKINLLKKCVGEVKGNG